MPSDLEPIRVADRPESVVLKCEPKPDINHVHVNRSNTNGTKTDSPTLRRSHHVAWKSPPAQHQPSSTSKSEVQRTRREDVVVLRRRNSSPKLKGSFLPSLSSDKALTPPNKAATSDLDPLLKIRVCTQRKRNVGNWLYRRPWHCHQEDLLLYLLPTLLPWCSRSSTLK